MHTKNPKLGLAMENEGIFHGHLVFVWYILWSFGIFPRFGVLYHEKSGNPS
jgi:hypothetical protein